MVKKSKLLLKSSKIFQNLNFITFFLNKFLTSLKVKKKLNNKLLAKKGKKILVKVYYISKS